MTDREKIRAELTRRINERLLWIKKYPRSKRIAIWEALNREEESMLRYIDFLHEEPVSEYLEEAAEEYSESDPPKYGDRYYWDSESLFGEQIKNTFKAGANWQKQQMMKDAIGNYWIARDKNVSRTLNIYEDIPERVHLDDGRKFWRAFHYSVNLPSEIFDEIQWENEPQKVKLIIIKEEEK